MPEIQMPKLSDTMTEGTRVARKKKKGDKVSAGEVLAEIESDKRTMEWESSEDGKLTEIYVEEGGKVNGGDKIALIGEEGEEASKEKEGEKGKEEKEEKPKAEEEKEEGKPKKEEAKKEEKPKEPKAEKKEEKETAAPKTEKKAEAEKQAPKDEKAKEARVKASHVASRIAVELALN